jgi:hypothetical protein
MLKKYNNESPEDIIEYLPLFEAEGVDPIDIAGGLAEINRYRKMIKTGNIILEVKTIETSLKSAPRRFMKNSISVVDHSDGASHLEALAAEQNVILFEQYREITAYPKKYAGLHHRAFVEEMSKNCDYHCLLKEAVKKAL